MNINIYYLRIIKMRMQLSIQNIIILNFKYIKYLIIKINLYFIINDYDF